ncbi:MAG TPA: hypothetical protein ACQGQI_04000 [Xylella sp.]
MPDLSFVVLLHPGAVMCKRFTGVFGEQFNQLAVVDVVDPAVRLDRAVCVAARDGKRLKASLSLCFQCADLVAEDVVDGFLVDIGLWRDQ